MLLEKDFVMQGGVRNYLGETEEVTAPKFWQSSEDSPPTELAYITEAEKGLLADANLHGSLKDGKPNMGASGLLSFDGFGSTDPGQNRAGGDVSSSMDRGGDDGNDRFGSSTGGGESFQGVNTPSLPPGVTSNNFDYETEAFTNIDSGYGLGKIESSFYNPETKEVTITQTPGIINTEQYQTANLEAYLNSNAVSDKDKVDTLNQLQSLSNSDLKGSKLSGIENDFVLDNLDKSFNNIKNQTKYSKFTSAIDENSTTFADDITSNPLKTIANSGGFLGTIYRGSTDYFKNNKALELLGYDGKTIKYNPDGSGDFNYGGGFLTGNVSNDERDAINQLTPLAADFIGGTTPQESMVNKYFANNSANNLGISKDFMTSYDQAKADLAKTLNMTANTDQFGYSANMSASNIYYNYLKEQGLL